MVLRTNWTKKSYGHSVMDASGEAYRHLGYEMESIFDK